MADAVTTKTLFSGTNEVTIKITNISDSTGESGVKKLDISTLTGPNGVAPVHLSLLEATGAVNGMSVKVFSNKGTNPTTWLVASGVIQHLDYRPYSGVPDAGTGTNDGSVMVTTAGQAANSTYDLTLTFRMLTA